MANPNLFAQYAQPVRSFTDYTQQLEQLNNQRLMGDNLAQQNAIRAAAMQDAERQRMAQEREQNALAALTAQAGGDESRYADLLRQGGYFGQAQKLEEGRAKIGKDEADARAKALETKRKAFEYVIQGLQTANDPQTAAQMVSGAVAQGAMSMQQAQQFAAGIPQDPAQFAQWRAGTLRSILAADKQLQQFQTRNTGATTDTIAIDPVTGQVRVANSVKNTMSPDAAASNAVQQGRLALDRQKFAFEQNKPQAGQPDPNKPLAAGSPAAQAKDANEALALLDQAEPLIKGATGSYLGSALDTVAQAFGFATEGSIKTSQLRALEGALISKMPKMSGPQSDKDVLLYKQMAGQIGDPTIPYANKAAAIQAIREIQNRYAGNPTQAQPSGAPSVGAVVDGYRFKGGNPADQKNWEPVK